MNIDKTTMKDSLLNQIKSIRDIQQMSVELLEHLGQEIRELIIQTVSQNGGHLASSLGVVELTLAILKVFSPPHDRIVFDVGHQAYAYKILTERRDIFHTLRTKGGIAGFPKREESQYDFFDVGHAGNAISAAAGYLQPQASPASSPHTARERPLCGFSFPRSDTRTKTAAAINP